jgi:hypothetical protein
LLLKSIFLNNLFLNISFVFITAVFQGYTQGTVKSRGIDNGRKYAFVAYPDANIVLSGDEFLLYQLIMDYRKANGKPVIPLSKALTFVAQTHAGDLTKNYRLNEKCDFHSWSKKGSWTPCCYTKDHANAECSWNKPGELTTYAGSGFEVAYFDYRPAIPSVVLEKWKKNPTNNEMLLTSGNWEKVTWNAVGIGMFGNYATVWFGKLADKDGEPGIP